MEHSRNTENLEVSESSDRIQKTAEETSREILVIIGPSCVGKDTVVSELLRRSPEIFQKPVSFTTREPREKETDGKDYYFITKEEFRELEKEGNIFEYVQVHGNYYGYTREEINRVLSNSQTPLFVVDPVGNSYLKENFAGNGYEIKSFFILPPELKTIKQRLKKRCGADTESFKFRFRESLNWSKYPDFRKYYDYFVTNKNYQKAAEFVERIFFNGFDI